MKQMSFFYTQEQIRNRTKTVTRRLGWKGAKPGDHLQAVVKSQGLKRGQHPEVLAEIEIVDVRQEPLDIITNEECIKEGRPDLNRDDFIAWFCDFNMHRPDWPVTRIEFKYMEET